MNRRAFTLIELLTVIAIIALLAAIIYPVFSAVRANANKTACMSNMSQIYQALKLYHSDYDAYPPILLGYVEVYSNVTQPCNQLKQSPLFPSRITSVDLFHCPQNNVTNLTQVVNAVWPNMVHWSETTPGSGKYDWIPVQPDLWGKPVVDAAKNVVPFYAYDSYDIGRRNPKDPSSLFELHYTIFWTAPGMGGGDPTDDPRQLGYRHPDETAVVTWCPYHRNWSRGSAEPQADKQDPVLFLSGQVKPMNSKNLYEKGFGERPLDQ